MRVLIVIEHCRKKSFLVNLHTERLAEEVRRLVNKGRRSQAIIKALSEGRFERGLAHDKFRGPNDGLVLSEENVMWDIMGKK